MDHLVANDRMGLSTVLRKKVNEQVKVVVRKYEDSKISEATMPKLLLPLLLLLAFAGMSLAQSTSRVENELTGLVKQLTDAQTAYDAKALDKLFTADYIEISPAGEFDPRVKVLGFYTPEAKAAAGNVTTSVEIAEPSVRN